MECRFGHLMGRCGTKVVEHGGRRYRVSNWICPICKKQELMEVSK